MPRDFGVRPKAGGAPSASCCGRNRRDSRFRHSGCVCLNPGRRFLPVAILSSSERRRRSRRSWRVSRMRTSRSSGCGRSRIAGGSLCVDFVVLRFGHDGRLEAIDPHLANSGSSAPASDVCARGPRRHRPGLQQHVEVAGGGSARQAAGRSGGASVCGFAGPRGLRAAAACRVLPVVRAHRSVRSGPALPATGIRGAADARFRLPVVGGSDWRAVRHG